MGVLLCGCFDHSGAMQVRAASEIGCLERNVDIVRMPGNAYRARGCGRDLIYVCAQGGWGPTCVLQSSSERQTTRRSAAPTTAVPTEWSNEAVLNLLTRLETSTRACVPDERLPLAVELEIMPDGSVRHRGVQLTTLAPLEAECMSAALRDARATGRAAAPRTAVLRVAPRAAGGERVEQAEDQVGASVRRQLDTIAEGILACVDASAVAVAASWTTSGEVTLSLRGDRAGTPEEGCVRAAASRVHLEPPPTTAGALIHAVTR